MQFKPIPEPPASIDRIERVRGTLPETPAPEVDCCSRVIDGTGVDRRNVAADWIVFLRALGLVERGSDGYRSTTAPVTTERLGAAFRERVIDVDTVLAELETSTTPLTADEVARRLNAGGEIDVNAVDAPGHRRTDDSTDDHRTVDSTDDGRTDDGRMDDSTGDTRTDRVERILAWAMSFGLVERVDDGFRSA